jgi:leucyl aminopeptidase
MTVCTLTGHAVVSVGPYGITLDNSVAKRDGQSYALQAHGEVWGDPLEVRTSKQSSDTVSRTTQVSASALTLTSCCTR